MNDNILKVLNKNCQNSLSFSTDLYQITNNITQEKMVHTVDITVTDPYNMNSRSSITPSTPMVQLNNTIANSLVSSAEYSGSTSSNSSDTSYIAAKLNMAKKEASFVKNAIIKNTVKLSDIINRDAIIIRIKKPPGFNDAFKETVNRKGSLKILDSGNKVVYDKQHIISCLYNREVTDYFLKNNGKVITGNQKVNMALLKCGNNIPIKIINDHTFNTLLNYDLTDIIIEIPISSNNNIFKNLLKIVTKKTRTMGNNIEYNLDFGLFFDAEIVDKFPVEFLQIDGASVAAPNSKLLTSISKQQIIITGESHENKFQQDCIGGIYKKLYIIFN